METRYIDADYRSEYSALYSRAFASYEDSTHRLHFFGESLAESDVLSIPEGAQYLGYIIIRPQVRAVVGRTMLRPPPDLRGAVRTGVTEEVVLFGQRLSVRAVPFMQQDSKLGSCAHAAAWMTHYSAARAGRGVARSPIAAFSEAVDPTTATGRLIPSTGLTLQQLSRVLAAVGLFPIYYDVNSLAGADRPVNWPPRRTADSKERAAAAKRVCCRYLNSGLPVLAVLRIWLSGSESASRHAVVVCGYKRSAPDSQDVTLVINDDRRGPYLTVIDVEKDTDGSWDENYKFDQLLIPAPEKLWMSGETAERNGCVRLLAAARAAAEAGFPGGQEMLDRHADGDLTVRTYAIEANRFKRRVRDRYADPVVVAEYSFARFPHYVWVVEAIDRKARSREASGPGDAACVLGEVIYDATSDDVDPHILALRLPGLLSLPKPHDPDWGVECGSAMQLSGGQYEP